MEVNELIWLNKVRHKIIQKHNVWPEEVEEVFGDHPKYWFVQEGTVNKGEDLYSAMGRTEAGRLLIVFFILKSEQRALIITARDATRKERKRYERK